MLLKYHTIKGHRGGPHLLITAGVHGDEWEPMIAARQLIATSRAEELSGTLTVVPVVNESAYRRGQRVGEDGLDLARVCPGRADGSVTERVAHELADLMECADYYIDLHTGGVQLEVWPLVGYLLHSNEKVLNQQREIARAFNLPFVWGTDGTIQGRTISVARDLAIPAIYVEYLGSATFNRDAIEALVQGCRNVMIWLGLLARQRTADAVRFVSEDFQTGAGHLQSGHPAPVSGLFDATVRLGDEIAQGEPIGILMLDDNSDTVPIMADNSGRVVALRRLPRVQAGDGLGVVVAVTEINS